MDPTRPPSKRIRDRTAEYEKRKKERKEYPEKERKRRQKERDATEKLKEDPVKWEEFRARRNAATRKCRAKPDIAARCKAKSREYYETRQDVKLKRFKTGATERKISIEITDEMALMMFQDRCYYCRIKKEHVLNGIDRVVNEKHYIPGNCTPCCATCNMAKVKLSADDFIAMGQRIAVAHSMTA